MPTPGESRAGRSYSVFIKVPATGDTVAFTVFEPVTLTSGETYPLILHSHGFQGARYKSRPVPLGPLKVDFANPLGSDFTDIGVFIDKGYGVISIDQRAHGDSNGSNRVMDPDFEGKNLLAVLDWAEANLPWLKYGMSADGSDPHNLVLGSIGTSYGGMFQYLIHNIDPKKRLDAMVPMWAPYDLTYSLSQGNVPKTLWNVTLFGIGNLTGLKTLTGFDPFIFNGFVTSFAQNELTPDLKDLLLYHSNRYFCEGKPVATNGGPGTRPERPPVAGGKVNVLLGAGHTRHAVQPERRPQQLRLLQEAGRRCAPAHHPGGPQHPSGHARRIAIGLSPHGRLERKVRHGRPGGWRTRIF